MYPCLYNQWRIVSRDATDGDDGQWDFLNDLFQEVEPARWACVFLGERGVDRTKTDIICAF
jgi:hypothetical protein